MEKIKKLTAEYFAPISIFALFFAYLFVNSRMSYNLYDEGIISYGATRVMNGDIPYKGFWTMYAPGQFYVVALLFKIFGLKLIVMRNYSVFLDMAAVTFIYFTVRMITSRITALLCLSIVVLSFLYWPPSYGSPSHGAALFVFSAIYFLARYFSGGRNANLYAAGICIGLTTIFKHDLGAYLLVSCTAVVITHEFTNRGSIGKPRILRGAAAQPAKMLLAFTLAILPVLTYFLIKVPAGELINDLVIFPLTAFPLYRSLHYPHAVLSVSVFPYYFPIVVYLIAVIGLFVKIIRNKQVAGTDAIAMLLTLSGIIFFNYARVRSDTGHLFFASMPAIMLLPYFTDADSSGGNNKWVRLGRALKYLSLIVYVLSFYEEALKCLTVTLYLLPVMTALLIILPVLVMRQLNSFPAFYRKILVAVSIIMCAIIFGWFYRESNFRNIPGRYIFAPVWPGMVESKFTFTRGINVIPGKEDASLRVAGYIRSKTGPGEAVFVGALRHDKIFINDIMMYNICERKCATKYHELHPGMITTREVQDKVIKDIMGNKVKYIALHDMTGGYVEPNKSSVSSGVTDLDDFLKINFEPVFCAGDQAVLKLRAKPEK